METKIKAIASLSRKRRRERSLGGKPWFSTGKHSRGRNGMEGKEWVGLEGDGRGESREEGGQGVHRSW